MKIRISTVLLSIFLSIGLFGQNRYDYSIKNPAGISSVNEAATMAEEIVKAVGLKANFRIAEANVPNALAVLTQGKRYILYNPQFVNKLTEITGSKWTAYSVLAHEIGHHLYNTLTGKSGRTLATELEADEFSGYVLEKMGASLEEAQAAMNILATPYATQTHPARRDRINSIAAGWQDAGGIISETEPAREDVVTREPQRYKDEQNVLSVIARLQFNNSPGSKYYITNKLNFVKVENDEVSILGSIDQSDDKRFPFIIFDINGSRLFISSSGEIVNSRGYVIGNMTKV